MVSYVFVRMRKEDYERLINQKKIPMQQEIRNLINNNSFNLKNPDFFKIVSRSTIDLGEDYQRKLLGSIKFKGAKFSI